MMGIATTDSTAVMNWHDTRALRYKRAKRVRVLIVEDDPDLREFMALLILADGIDRAKSTDGDKIRQALAATDLPGDRTIMPWNRVKFDETGQNNDADPVLLQYVKGRFLTIFPQPAAIAEPIWPMIPSTPRMVGEKAS